MKLATSWLVILCYGAVLCGQWPSTAALDSNSIDQPAGGCRSEEVLSKLDSLLYKLVQVDLTTKEREEGLTERLSKLEASFGTMQWSITRLDLAVGQNLTYLQDESHQILAQRRACANHEQMRKEIAELTTLCHFNISSTRSSLHELPPSRPQPVYASCKAVPGNVSGVYLLQPTAQDAPFEAFCEQSSFGGGWLVIQYRFDGTLDFYRNWAEYRNGFGSVDREFWLGLERLHQLTTQASYDLLIELKDFTGTYKYAGYNSFVIGSEAESYSLKRLGPYNGTAGESLSAYKGAAFATKDHDNSAKCAVTNEAGWWYTSCDYSNLNGRYIKDAVQKSIFWWYFKGGLHGLAYSRMMIRELGSA